MQQVFNIGIFLLLPITPEEDTKIIPFCRGENRERLSNLPKFTPVSVAGPGLEHRSDSGAHVFNYCIVLSMSRISGNKNTHHKKKTEGTK